VATIRDVARASGVSIATVSRVTNGSARVTEETRRRVWEAAVRLDYWPNGAARTLTTNLTGAVGILLPDLYGEFFSEVLRGIDRAARARRHQMLVSSSHADMDTILASSYAMHGRVDGLIVMAPEAASESAIEQIRRRFPMVLLNPRHCPEGCSAVSVRNFEGAHEVARHLLRLGHRRFALIQGPAGNVDAEERLRGYRLALAQAGVEGDAVLEVPGDFTEASGHAAAAAVLSRPRRPTAALAANDYMAIGLLGALREAGVPAPGGIAVAGFDDIAIGRYLHPSLTTVHVDACAMGEMAMNLLLGSIGGISPYAARHETLPATLVVRESCGAAGAASRPRPGTRAAPSRLSASPSTGGKHKTLPARRSTS
jgi:LacI family transcriptional regulator